jgi:hypothetical protein
MSTKRTLKLSLERQFFDAIATGHKAEEYRDRKEYWATRLEGRDYDTIIFRNGYGPKVPEMEVEFKGVRKTTRKGDAIYAIQLGKILSIKRWKSPAEVEMKVKR